MKRHAVYVQFDPSSNHPLLVGRCLKILHGYQRKHQINLIGVTFPDFSDEAVGGSMAFVSPDETCLKKLLEQHYFQQMQRLEKFHIHDPVSVPENSPEVQFVRERSRDKSCAGGRLRAIRRGQKIAERKGYEYQPRQASEKVVRHILPYHDIPMTSSKDEAKVFLFRLQRQKVNNVGYGGFTSYGLSNKDSLGGTVPEQIFT